MFYIIREELPQTVHMECTKPIKLGFWTANIALAFFFGALVIAGIGKGVFPAATFQETMLSIRPFLVAFTVSGVFLMAGFWIILWHAFRLTGLITRPAAGEAVAEPA